MKVLGTAGIGALARWCRDAWQQVTAEYLRTNKTRSLLRGSAASLLVRVGGMGLRLLSGVLLARLLGATDYGVYAYAVTWLGVLTMPTALGLDQVLLRFVAGYKETGSWAALRGLLQFAGLLGGASAVAVGLAAAAAVSLLGHRSEEFRLTMWITLALLPVVVTAQLRQASLRGLDRPVLAQLPENIVYPGLLCAIVATAHFVAGASLTVPQVALANAAAWGGALVLGTIFLLRALPRPIRVSAPAYERRAWLNMVPALVFIGAAFHLVNRGDVLVLGALGTSRDVGIYTVASRSAELMLFMYDAITLAGASLFSSIYVTGDREELQRFTGLAAKIILWVSLPVYLIFLAAAPWLLGLFGPEFVEGTSAMRMLTTMNFVSSLGGFVIVMMYMTGHQSDVAVAMAAAAAINLGLSYLLVPRLGITGAAIASGTSLLLLKGTLVILLYKRVGILSLPLVFRFRHGRPISQTP